ncbi:RNA polymerase II degradation factor 1-like [Varroa destructor]|uniref:Uncharacterized protein n=1 Tax=Varroa destructor TaxID=109461 RepID=A0A7M7K3F1_VARDE|nr:RNA polymerase II degradation factor 1-like [Varroa destructor]
MKSYSSVLLHLVLMVCSIWYLPSEAYEYNIQITHGPPAPNGDSPYDTQARSSVHVRGPQSQTSATASVATSEATAPEFKDEQAYASEGYHGYSTTDKNSAPQYAVSQPDSKYRYTVEGQNEEPQTEIRYVNQEEAAKYHGYQSGPEQEQSIKYVPTDEAHKYQQPTPAAYQHVAPQRKYQGYRQEFEAQKYQTYQPVPQAEKYQSYPPSSVTEKYQTYEAPQSNKYQTYQTAPQAYQAVQAQPEKYQSYETQPNAEKYRGYPQSAIQKYPTSADAEQKIQYVTPDQQTQYAPAQQEEQQVQYVPQFETQTGHSQAGPAAPAKHRYGQAGAYEKQSTGYAQPGAYHYAAPEAKYQTAAGAAAKFNYPASANVQYVTQPQYAKAPAHVAEKYTSSPYTVPGQKVKFEFSAATSYVQNGEYLKSPKAHGVAQSASVTQPVAHKYVPSAHPDLAQVAAHGASAYGHAYAGNAAPGFASEGYPHPDYAHPAPAPAGQAAVHAVYAEPQVHAVPSTALQAYHVPHPAGPHVTAQAAPVHKTTSQHSFPEHLARGIARNSPSLTAHDHKVYNFYDEKKSAAKKSSKKKSS